MFLRRYKEIMFAVIMIMLLQTNLKAQYSKISKTDNLINTIKIKMNGTLQNRDRKTDKVVYTLDVNNSSYNIIKSKINSIVRQDSDIYYIESWGYNSSKEDYDIYKATLSLDGIPTRVYVATNGIIVFYASINRY